MGFDPISLMAGGSLILGAAGAGVKAAGAVSEGEAQQQAANFSAQVARNNAIAATQNADYAIESGMTRAEAESLKGASRAGEVKAAQASHGIDVNTGSAVKVQESQREQEKLDTETVMSNAELQAYGYRTQATNFTAQAGLDVLTGENAKEASEFKAAGGLLGDASSLGTKWAEFGQSQDKSA